MTPQKRIIYNTLAQYTRTIINTLLALVTTRIVLNLLGEVDYGIFSLIGGVVALLGFVTNGMLVSTQRFLSVSQGKEDLHLLQRVFTTSWALHIGIACCLVALLALLKGLFLGGGILGLSHGFCHIPADRLQAASIVYYIMLLSLSLSILSAPFKALTIAHENIVYTSLIEVADAALKLTLVLIMLRQGEHALVGYIAILFSLQLFNLLAYSTYARIRYKECRIRIRHQELEPAMLREIASFAGWSTYGTGSVVARNQGTAIVLNHFFGTVINAAFGLALQIFGILFTLSSSIMNAMNPQLMKAEGNGNREQALAIAVRESKYGTALLLLLFIPLWIEIPSLLQLWLSKVPEGTVLFTRMYMAMIVFDQLTYGLNALNLAAGNIRQYTLLTYTPKLLLPLWIGLALWGHAPLWAAAILMAGTELLVALVRLPYAERVLQVASLPFIRQAWLPLLPMLLAETAICVAIVVLISHPFRWLLTGSLALLTGLAIAYLTIGRQLRKTN